MKPKPCLKVSENISMHILSETGREKILDSLKKDLEGNLPFCRASFGYRHN